MGIPSLIKDAVRRIAEHGDPERIMLFGSCAKGMIGPDSDIDLLVVMNTDVPRPFRLNGLKPLFLEYPVPIDLIVLTEEEYEDECRKPYSFVYSASISGIVLYERGVGIKEGGLR